MNLQWTEKEQTCSIQIKTPQVYADEKCLEQVLVNLLTNANKYTQRKGNITVSWVDSFEKAEVLLQVKDTGPGIAQEHHSRLFDRFYRVDLSRSREAGGTGLGLAIVKHIMQEHEGQVQLKSELGKGSTFICHFLNK